MKKPVNHDRKNYRVRSVALGPTLFLLVELFFRPEAVEGVQPELVRHTVAVTLWIAAWWITEALPIPATSLLPVVVFPLLGLSSVNEVAAAYGNEIIFLFLGGFLIALAMERTGLQERIARAIIGVFGRDPRFVVLGFMVATALLSMWVSNTATTLMLLPVALALLSRGGPGGEAPSTAIDQPLAVALLLGIAFAANIGGLGTPVGSPPNVLFQTIYQQKTGLEVSFLQWMLYALPVVIILLPLTWLVLVHRLEAGRRIPIETSVLAMDRAQWWVTGVFAVTVILWISRGDIGHFHGWGTWLGRHGIEIKDSTVAILGALVLFIAPGRRGKPILDWSIAPRLPWGVLLLIGAGFAISNAFDQSGLTLWLAAQLRVIGDLPLPTEWIVMLVLASVVCVSILITEFASNTASAGILLPVVYGLSSALGGEEFPPEVLMIACAIACTTGFAVPAGTPPNALAFATERISIGCFVRIGLCIDLMAAVIIVGVFTVFA